MAPRVVSRSLLDALGGTLAVRPDVGVAPRTPLLREDRADTGRGTGAATNASAIERQGAEAGEWERRALARTSRGRCERRRGRDRRPSRDPDVGSVSVVVVQPIPVRRRAGRFEPVGVAQRPFDGEGSVESLVGRAPVIRWAVKSAWARVHNRAAVSLRLSVRISPSVKRTRSRRARAGHNPRRSMPCGRRSEPCAPTAVRDAAESFEVDVDQLAAPAVFMAVTSRSVSSANMLSTTLGKPRRRHPSGSKRNIHIDDTEFHRFRPAWG